MALKLSKSVAERGIITGLEGDLVKAGLNGEDIIGRINYLASNPSNFKIDFVHLTGGRKVYISELPALPESKINEIYRKLYVKRSRNFIEQL